MKIDIRTLILFCEALVNMPPLDDLMAELADPASPTAEALRVLQRARADLTKLDCFRVHPTEASGGE